MSERPPAGGHIRWLMKRDMPEIREIELTAFEFPWSEEDFFRVLLQRNCIGMVADAYPQVSARSKVLGYVIYEIHKTRLHLLNFAVAPDQWRRGIGTQMVRKLVSKLGPARPQRTHITLNVRESNLSALKFFRANGFRAVSIQRDFYVDTPDDSYLLTFRTNSQCDAGDGVSIQSGAE